MRRRGSNCFRGVAVSRELHAVEMEAIEGLRGLDPHDPFR
jgi:hypothetical protein